MSSRRYVHFEWADWAVAVDLPSASATPAAVLSTAIAKYNQRLSSGPKGKKSQSLELRDCALVTLTGALVKGLPGPGSDVFVIADDIDALVSLKGTSTTEMATRDALLDALSRHPADVRLLSRLGVLWSTAGRYDRAVDAFSKANSASSSGSQFTSQLAEAMARQAREWEQTHARAQDGGSTGDLAQLHQAIVKLLQDNGARNGDRDKVLLARSLVKLGFEAQANGLYAQLLGMDRPNSSPDQQIATSHYEAVLDYAEMVLVRGQVDQALAILLRLVTRDIKHDGVGRLLAALLESNPATMVPMLEDGVLTSAPAVGLIANLAKQHGALEAHLLLLQRQAALVEGRIDEAMVLLALLHAYELVGRPEEGLVKAKAILEKFGSLQIAGVSCRQVLDLWTHEDAAVPQPLGPSDEERLAEGELTVLSSWMTIAKLLFVAGHVDAARRVAKLLFAIREGRDLHLTSIRNEQAYLANIHTLLEVPTRLVPSEAERKALKPIYVLGDSHTLSLAWRAIGTDSVGIPVLVTGLKCWHLRAASDFYPKAQLHRLAATKIPRGATVLVVLGEIDCREGILDAVAKCRYDSIDEGQRATVAVYVAKLLELKKAHGWATVHVHPVNPVLPETRALIRTFNAILKAAVGTSAGQLHWIDMPMADLVDVEKDVLKPQFVLDGTHLNPSYIDVLEQKLL